MVGFIKSVVEMMAIIVIMFRLSYRLTLVSFMVIPLIVLAAVLFRRTRRVWERIRAKLSAINAFGRTFGRNENYQIFNMQEKKYEEFDQINKNTTMPI